MAERHEKFLAQLHAIQILFDTERYGELVRLITKMLRENPDPGYLYRTFAESQKGIVFGDDTCSNLESVMHYRTKAAP